MEKPQPTNLPSMVRVPQVPPQQVAGNRRVYIPPTLRRVPLYMSAPGPHRQHYFASTAAALTRPLGYQYTPIAQQLTQTPDGRIAPALKLPANLHKPLAWQQLPQTPGLLSFANEISQWSPITEIHPGIPQRNSQSMIPVTPPCSIPAYFPTRFKREEPGLGETLLGCGMLLLISVIALALLYYLST